ncbi:ABC transporter substrate-binding protein [Paenibacillus sp. sgz302251]|uniref:ABC transporter substrate-binding protein n=1 Tax=Paenibacillus sp. sgz302251 TaxID=3414493 RepID=UPI003C7C8D30
MSLSKMGFILLSIVMIMGLIACSNAGSNKQAVSETGNTNAQTDTNGSQTEKETADKGPVKLRYMVWGSPNEKKAVEDYSKKYMELNPEVTIEIIHVPNDDYDTKVATMVAGNDAPDLAYMSEGQAYELAKEGKLYNVFEQLESDPDFNLNNYAPNTWFEWEPGKALGRRIGIGAMGMYYNKTVFEKAGIEPLPRSLEDTMAWDQFVELAKQLTVDQSGKTALDPDFDPTKIKQYGVMFETWWANYLPLVLSNGGGYVSDDGMSFGLSEPEAYEAIQKMADLINVHHVAPNPVQLKSLPNLATSLQTGKAAMVFGGNWLTLDLSAAKANFGYGLYPRMKENAAVILASPVVIFNSTKNIDQVWKFYKFAADPGSAIGIYSDGLSIPVLKEWLTDEEKLNQWAVNDKHPDGYIDVMIKPLFEESTKPGPADLLKNYAKIDTIVTPALDNVWQGKQTAEDAMNEIKPKVEPLLEGVYEWSH